MPRWIWAGQQDTSLWIAGGRRGSLPTHLRACDRPLRLLDLRRTLRTCCSTSVDGFDTPDGVEPSWVGERGRNATRAVGEVEPGQCRRAEDVPRAALGQIAAC